jgi:hypothetical protein
MVSSLRDGAGARLNGARRALVLRERALALGVAWAKSTGEELRRQRRRVTGGWPGTLREARARARAHFTSADAWRACGVLTPEEFETAARLTYACARSEWLTRAMPDLEGRRGG